MAGTRSNPKVVVREVERGTHKEGRATGSQKRIESSHSVGFHRPRSIATRRKVSSVRIVSSRLVAYSLGGPVLVFLQNGSREYRDIIMPRDSNKVGRHGLPGRGPHGTAFRGIVKRTDGEVTDLSCFEIFFGTALFLSRPAGHVPRKSGSRRSNTPIRRDTPCGSPLTSSDAGEPRCSSRSLDQT